MNKKIVLATSNPGKVKELKNLLSGYKVKILLQSEFVISDVEENRLTFVENAILKARNACGHTDLPAIADDSGIAVDSLNGAPGIYSARYAGEDATSQDNIGKLLTELGRMPKADRTARFICVMVYMRHAKDPSPIIAEGIWEGKILHAASGTQGFGYDPIFYAPEHNCSAANISQIEKNKISHRGKALKDLVSRIVLCQDLEQETASQIK